MLRFFKKKDRIIAFVYDKNITNLSQKRKATQRNKINSAILRASAREKSHTQSLLSVEGTRRCYEQRAVGKKLWTKSVDRCLLTVDSRRHKKKTPSFNDVSYILLSCSLTKQPHLYAMASSCSVRRRHRVRARCP